MARIFITGSADGLGKFATAMLINQGHNIVLYARNDSRGKEAMHKIPGAERVLTADLSVMDEIKSMAERTL
jgi:NAD(P)-dependent dehydrogenase (short-subunit alcohol dehydrogenase family)